MLRNYTRLFRLNTNQNFRVDLCIIGRLKLVPSIPHRNLIMIAELFSPFCHFCTFVSTVEEPVFHSFLFLRKHSTLLSPHRLLWEQN